MKYGACMITNQCKIIFKIFSVVAVIQKVCFAAEDRQDDSHLGHIRNHIPFVTQSAQSIPPAVQEINKQLRQHYSRLNPNIHLPEAAYAEISQISQQYESAPVDIFYNHQLNQVKLIWQTGGFFGFLRSKKKTFELAPAETVHSRAPSAGAEQANTPIDWINSELSKYYGHINADIALLAKSYNEISHITMRHESYPEEILYNHQKNQVQLVWKKRAGCFSFGKTKRTYNLVNKIIRNPTREERAQVSQQQVLHATILATDSHTDLRSVHHPVAPDYYVAQHLRHGVPQREVRRYALSEQAARSVFDEWHKGLDPRYAGVYLTAPDYRDLLTELRKRGKATLAGWIENPNSWVLWATWSNHQRRYQLWGLG